MTRKPGDYNIDADAVIEDLSGQIAALIRDNAVLRAVIASLQSDVVELQSKHTHSHDERDSK
jgi:hypothetical protein